MRAKLLSLICAVFVITCPVFQAADSSPARLLRVSLVQGDVTYQRTDLDRWVDLSINTPILEGDKIWVGRDGRAEVEFENGSFARLSENTIVELSRLPDVNDTQGIEIRLNQGLASFDILPAAGFAVHTSLFSARLRDAASFRLDVETDGSGRLVVFHGRVEVSGASTRLFLRNGETVRFLSQDADRYYLETNYVKDDWDRWNDERKDYLSKITQERFHYGDRGWTTADLYNYGSWYDVPTYGRIWRPTVSIDWVPFRSGRWVWYSSFGWTWVSYEPWGWVPYHYGRWANVTGYGWSWVPGPRYVSWCPGAVNWVQGPHWVGWVPLAPYEPWYGYGHSGVNVFVSKNFGHRGAVTYLPHDSFVNGTPARGFRSPRDPYTDGRIIAGQPRVAPTPASRMPVAGNPAPRVYTNEDLEARRNLRERILNAGRSSPSQEPSAQLERLRQERSRLSTRGTSGFGNNSPTTNTGSGLRTIPSVSASGQPQTESGTRSYDNWGNRSAVRSEQRQRIYRLDGPDSSSLDASGQRLSPSTWARPTAPVARPPIDQTPNAPSSNSEDRSSSRQRLYEVYRGRIDSGSNDRYPSRPVQRESPSSRFNPYTPPSPPRAMSNPAGPPPSHRGHTMQPVGPPPSYQGHSSRDSVSRSQSGNTHSGASSQENRATVRGRMGR
ncbi:MAG: FecR domain-containing protein [Acidobacteria bacterium]|nr:FecR domain-containing protein [Acidobacteriota bacterium]MCI0722860.1 FecR domain-containing protein [Acidobacteriota bacterium]